MKLFVNYNLDKVCSTLLCEKLDKLNVKYRLVSPGFVYFSQSIPIKQYEELRQELNRYGISIIDNQKAIIVQRIKTAINVMLNSKSQQPLKVSSYLSLRLKENYRMLSNVFNEVCHISIESYVILQKIERVKLMLINDEVSLTEISYKMHYSSVAHLSNQFKKSTGLTPSDFQYIIRNKRNLIGVS